MISVLLVCLQTVESPHYVNTAILPRQFFTFSESSLGCLTIEDFDSMIFRTSGFSHPVTVSYPRTPGCSAALLWEPQISPSRGYNRNMFWWCKLDWVGSESCLVDGLSLHSITTVCYNWDIAHWLVCLLVRVGFRCKLICLVLTITWCVWYVQVKQLAADGFGAPLTLTVWLLHLALLCNYAK